ncbi:Yif1 family, partial [Dillenia turbinata]
VITLYDGVTEMYDNFGTQPAVPRPPTNPQQSPFGNAFYGASSGFIRGGLGAYGEMILGSSSEYVQSNYYCIGMLVKCDDYLRGSENVVYDQHNVKNLNLLVIRVIKNGPVVVSSLTDFSRNEVLSPKHGDFVMLAYVVTMAKALSVYRFLTSRFLFNIFLNKQISRYLSDPQYYFQVNDQYVRNKLKVVLFPFLHRGHWTRITEPVGGRLSYKPPIYDINAPDLYIPLMAFGTYVVLAGFSLGLGGRFSPEALNWLFIKGLVGWFLQVLLLKFSLLSLGSGEAPLLDIVAYAGYTFTGMCIAVLGKIVWSSSYYFLIPLTCICMGAFLVKTMKRVLFSEVRTYDSSRHHYLLIFLALAQFPLFVWLGNISVNWLF